MRILLLLALIYSAMPTFSAESLVVYSARKDHLIKPLFDAWTKKTGHEVRYITDKAGPLLQRLKAEGKRSRADILMTVDAGNLWHAAQEGVLQRVQSEVLTRQVPEHLRDPQGRWYGLSVRARTIVYSTERVRPEAILSYENLASAEWRGRLCLRTSKKVYNQSLVASLLARQGEEQTEATIKGWVENLAVPPFSNDTKVMKAIIAGTCDVGIVNTYYFGRLQKKDPGIPLALYWPNQTGHGVHVNISGAGITRYSRKSELATRFLEWLVSDEAQKIIARLNMEYPVRADIKADPLVSAWGAFRQDSLNVSEAGRLQADAVRLMDRAGYK